jgi:superfamily I DNA/RNA helicase
LIKTISERSRASLTIVGDDDQAIYEWRGATPEYILDPVRFFGVKFDTSTLATNYRSPKNIVDFAQKLIANNARRVPKQIRASRNEEASIVVKKTSDIAEAPDLVYNEVKEVVGAGGSPSKVGNNRPKAKSTDTISGLFRRKIYPFVRPKIFKFLWATLSIDCCV